MCHLPTKVLSSNNHNHFTALFPGQPGWAGARRELMDLWCKGRLTEADTPTIRLGATPSGLTSDHLHHAPYFYRPDALSATQTTASKHWRQNPHPRLLSKFCSALSSSYNSNTDGTRVLLTVTLMQPSTAQFVFKNSAKSAPAKQCETSFHLVMPTVFYW